MASKGTQGKKGTHRKLTAILCADVVGYSRLMGDDEEATIDFLRSKGCRMQRMQWWNWTSFVS